MEDPADHWVRELLWGRIKRQKVDKSTPEKLEEARILQDVTEIYYPKKPLAEKEEKQSPPDFYSSILNGIILAIFF